jgi:hypothetical protein
VNEAAELRFDSEHQQEAELEAATPQIVAKLALVNASDAGVGLNLDKQATLYNQVSAIGADDRSLVFHREWSFALDTVPSLAEFQLKSPDIRTLKKTIAEFVVHLVECADHGPRKPLVDESHSVLRVCFRLLCGNPR